MNVSFNPLAEQELNDATGYYEVESSGLGAAFLPEVERSCQAIAEYPKAAPVVVGSIRRRLVSRFPYALLYSVRSDHVRILAVMNLKRRPAYWDGHSCLRKTPLTLRSAGWQHVHAAVGF